MKSRNVMMVVMLLVIGGLTANNAAASTITWGAVKTQMVYTDVDTAGTFDRAYNFSLTTTKSYVVNGVTFAAFDAQPTDTVSWPHGGAFTDAAFPTTYNNGLTGSNAGLGKLLGCGFYDNGGVAATTLTLNGLTKGATYDVQVMVGGGGTQRGESVSGSPYFTYGSDIVVMGTFTADATSQVLALTPGSTLGDANASAQLSGLQLRMTAAPEPSTVVLLVTGLLGLLCYAWRKRK